MHHSPTNLNFCEEDRNAVKPEIIHYYNKHMGDVDLQHSVISVVHYNPGHGSEQKLFYNSVYMARLNCVLLTAC